MTRPWPGPALIKNVLIEGFETGVAVGHFEFAPSFENIVLKNQTEMGFSNNGNTVSLRNLVNENCVQALVNGVTVTGGSVVLLGATLTGGDAEKSAIRNSGYLFARGV